MRTHTTKVKSFAAWIASSRARRLLWATWLGFIVLSAIALTTARPVHAAGGLLDDVQGIFAGTTGPLLTTAQMWSVALFMGLAVFEVYWVAYEALFNTSSINDVIILLTKLAVSLGLGYWLVTNQIFVTQDLLALIARVATSFVLPGSNAITPDAIAAIGWTTASEIFNAVPDNAILNALLALPQFITALFVQITFIIVALEDLIIQIATQFCLAIGSLYLGLVATRWTRPYASSWSRMIFATLLLTVTISAIAGIGIAMGAHFTTMINEMAGQPWTGMLMDMSTIGASTFVYLFLGLGFTGLAGFLGASTPITLGGPIARAVSAYTGGVMGGRAALGSPVASTTAEDTASVATIEAAIESKAA